ncbi:MAG: DNA mismatch repair protein MutS [Chthonomonadales bacterium]
MQAQIPTSEESTYKPRTPLMQQYFGARRQHPGVILLMRVGDFYEAYGEDAETIAATLNITLTARDDGDCRVPMAGVPYHAVERYVARLLQSGLRVALMDQVEDPKQAKGLVKRRVTRVVSPGTVFEDALLEAGANNYLVAAVVGNPASGIGVVDVSTGEFLTTELAGEERIERLTEEICRLEPAEVLVPATQPELAEMLRQAVSAPVTLFSPREAGGLRNPREVLLRHFGTQSLRGFGCEEYTTGLEAAAMVLHYLRETQGNALAHITSLSTYSTAGFLSLDRVARRNLELTSCLGDGGRSRTLLGVLDDTLTPMGGRLLRRRIEEPLLDPAEIRQRLDAVEELASSELLRADLRAALRSVNDIERLVSRCAASLANARDLIGLKESLLRLPILRDLLRDVQSEVLRDISRRLGSPSPAPGSVPILAEQRVAYAATPADVAELIDHAIIPDAPPGSRDGGIIKPGYSAELDALRSLAAEGRAWIAELERKERERTGIPSLKVGYNAVFGYFIEVTKPHLSKVPADYRRKQTTASGERFITEALKEYEDKVLRADEKSVELEYTLFASVRERVAEASGVLLQCARAIAELDVTAALAEVAVRSHYVRPKVTESDVIRIRAGRHPVVERIPGLAPFVPNDCLLDCSENRLHIITGPNMSGKSTALRQVALIVIMAQMGSFVPADEAEIGVVDRIFTRVGAHDELATGQSTFMVEMSETANILNNATPRSLVILDEIGRGTSTYDGLSIAWAVAEYLAQIGCRTLFATHYHYLNDLARRLPSVKNYRMAVKEQGERIVWLHKLVPGGTDRSYGIQVARMAGVPPEVVARAQEILKGLEHSGAGMPADGATPLQVSVRKQKMQLTLFEAQMHPVLEELEKLELAEMTPVEALMKLDELQRALKRQA